MTDIIKIHRKIPVISNILILLFFILVYYNLIPTHFVLFLLLGILIKMTKNEISIVLLLFSGHWVGSISNYYSFPIPGALICYIIAITINFNNILKYLKPNQRSIKYLLLLFLLFFVFYLLGPMHQYSNDKIKLIITNGSITLVGFLILNNSETLNHKIIAKYLLAVCILYLSMAYNFAGFEKPMSVFDFSFFRTSAMLKMNDDTSISYHRFGITAMLGITFLLISNYNKIIEKKSLLITILLIYVLLISQARQAIFGSIIIVIIRVLLSNKHQVITKILSISLFLVFIVFILSNIQTIFFERTMNTNQDLGTILNRNINQPFKIIKENLLLGKGLGGYSTDGNRFYPHNIILEVFSELGILGFFSIIILFFIFLSKQRINLIKYTTKSNFLFILLIIALTIRAFISSDLTENIILFTAILSINFKNKQVCKQKN